MLYGRCYTADFFKLTYFFLSIHINRELVRDEIFFIEIICILIEGYRRPRVKRIAYEKMLFKGKKQQRRIKRERRRKNREYMGTIKKKYRSNFNCVKIEWIIYILLLYHIYNTFFLACTCYSRSELNLFINEVVKFRVCTNVINQLH